MTWHSQTSYTSDASYSQLRILRRDTRESQTTDIFPSADIRGNNPPLTAPSFATAKRVGAARGRIAPLTNAQRPHLTAADSRRFRRYRPSSPMQRHSPEYLTRRTTLKYKSGQGGQPRLRPRTSSSPPRFPSAPLDDTVSAREGVISSSRGSSTSSRVSQEGSPRHWSDARSPLPTSTTHLRSPLTLKLPCVPLSYRSFGIGAMGRTTDATR